MTIDMIAATMPTCTSELTAYLKMENNLYINLRRSRDGTRLFGWVFVCTRSSLHSVRFGQLLVLRCAHKRIVNIMNRYIERKNMQVELI